MQRNAFLNVSLRHAGQALSPRGQELDSLTQSDALRSRFFSWRGVSGRRYVCSVFQNGEEAFVSDVESGVVIGVTREGASIRPVFVLQARKGVESRALRELARELNVAEWHVHFSAEEATMRDLAGSLLN
ncbi:MAG: hypothetical protein CTY15_06840 [Methylocystis sp.]|nr:MAG: hypothetical protein CTY15_06840 [Methylocystis sp.]